MFREIFVCFSHSFSSFLSLVFRFGMAQPDCLAFPCDDLCKHYACVVVLLFCLCRLHCLLLPNLSSVFLVPLAFFSSPLLFVKVRLCHRPCACTLQHAVPRSEACFQFPVIQYIRLHGFPSVFLGEVSDKLQEFFVCHRFIWHAKFIQFLDFLRRCQGRVVLYAFLEFSLIHFVFLIFYSDSLAHGAACSLSFRAARKDEKCCLHMVALPMLVLLDFLGTLLFFYNISCDYAPYEACFHTYFGIYWSFCSLIENCPTNACQNCLISWTFFRYIVKSPTFRFAMCQKQAFRLAACPSGWTFPQNPRKVQLLPHTQAIKKR